MSEPGRAHVSELSASGYPWSGPVRAGVVGVDGLVGGPVPAPAELAGHTPVVAVGSNVSPEVLQRKLAGLLDPAVVIGPAVVEGMLVGHSAHVSVRGYVAAAPVRADGASTPVAVCWLTPDQARALDATEPNYDRVPLPAGMPCRTPEGQVVAGAHVYDSRHGVLAESGEALAFTSQSEVLRWLADRLPGLAAYGLGGEDGHERLADAGLRELIRRELVRHDLRTGSGLRG